MDAALQPLEPGWPAARVERDDLAVEHERRMELPADGFERRDERGKLRGLFVAEAGPETHGRSAARRNDFDNRPDAVVLRLVDEALAL